MYSLPERFARWATATIRAWAIAILGPIKFARDTGHFRGTLHGRPEAVDGRPIPWFTLPSVAFLETLDFQNSTVLEWGSGQSTLWWVSRGARVLSIEHDSAWYERVKQSLPDRATVDLRLIQDPDEYVKWPLGRQFDIVVIDGRSRARCAKVTLELVRDEGAVIIDDSEEFWGRPPNYPIIDLFREAGFLRVDFHGISSGVWHPRCTSFVFKPETRFLRDLAPPPRRYRRGPGFFDRFPWRQ